MFSTVRAILRRQISFGDRARSTNVSKHENLRKTKTSTIIIVVASYRQYPIFGENISHRCNTTVCLETVLLL